MSIENKLIDLFDKSGRRIPFEGMRVFNEESLSYYKINSRTYNYETILSNSKNFADIDKSINANTFEKVCSDLKVKLQADTSLKNLFKGIHVPFICPKASEFNDLGNELEKITLPSVASSFKASFPDLHCKATLQGSSKLDGQLSIAKDSRYQSFIDAHKQGVVVGWYFPQALQEYDIESQQNQMKTLPLHKNLVLSGGLDSAAALVGSPGLLVNKNDYPPVLCLSALSHVDERLMLCFKAYGHHLEFWCMSQMLAPGIKQVSEQWSGGLTLFDLID
jgi:hypothetical protein